MISLFDQGPVSWRPTTVKWRQFSQSSHHSTICTQQTEYHEALPSLANDEVRCDCTFADDGNASWYSVCRVPLLEWRLDCQNCRHLMVVCLHDTGSRFLCKMFGIDASSQYWDHCLIGVFCYCCSCYCCSCSVALATVANDPFVGCCCCWLVLFCVSSFAVATIFVAKFVDVVFIFLKLSCKLFRSSSVDEL